MGFNTHFLKYISFFEGLFHHNAPNSTVKPLTAPGDNHGHIPGNIHQGEFHLPNHLGNIHDGSVIHLNSDHTASHKEGKDDKHIVKPIIQTGDETPLTIYNDLINLPPIISLEQNLFGNTFASVFTSAFNEYAQLNDSAIAQLLSTTIEPSKVEIPSFINLSMVELLNVPVSVSNVQMNVSVVTRHPKLNYIRFV